MWRRRALKTRGDGVATCAAAGRHRDWRWATTADGLFSERMLSVRARAIENPHVKPRGSIGDKMPQTEDEVERLPVACVSRGTPSCAREGVHKAMISPNASAGRR